MVITSSAHRGMAEERRSTVPPLATSRRDERRPAHCNELQQRECSYHGSLEEHEARRLTGK